MFHKARQVNKQRIKEKILKKSKQKTFMPYFIDLIFFLKTRKVNFAGNKRKKAGQKLLFRF